jgi:galactose mutarotase-like enzyme
LEPWCGIADAINHNQQLEDKEGMEKLGSGESWERSWEICCF